MIDEKFIRPIPKYMIEKIKRQDKIDFPSIQRTRFYAYFARFGGELCKVTVAVKSRGKNKWFCKQVAVHGIHSDICLVKDIDFYYIAGYVVGWYEEGLSSYRRYYETGSWDKAKDKYFNIYAPILNMEFLHKFPEYRYSAVFQYPYLNIFKYLRLYEKYPQAEMLVKFGLSSYATSKQMLDKIGKDKKFRKWLIANSLEITYNQYYISTILSAYKTGRTLKDTQRFEEDKKRFFHNESYREIKAILPTNKEVARFLCYIREKNTNFSSYSDYVKACRYLGLDMTLDKNRFPHDFKRWHDIRIDEYRSKLAQEDAEKKKDLYAQFASIAEKYMPLERSQKDAYIVVIAKSPADLVREGDILHHCVGRMNYDQRFIREESLIFFIRNKETPDTPFVTVEYSLSKHKVLQCYGDRDSKPTDEVLNFVHKKWLPYANKKLKSIAA